MKYLRLGRAERTAVMDGLERMPAFVAERFAALSAEEAARPGPDGGFSPVEHCWHLADLEREGFAALCDLPMMMAEHDASHRAEIEAWSRARS